MREGVTASLPADWWGFISSKLQEVAQGECHGARPVKCADFGGAVDLSQEYQRRIGRIAHLHFDEAFGARALPDHWFRFLGSRLGELRELIRAASEPGARCPWIMPKLEAERRACDFALALSLEYGARVAA